MMRSYIPSSIWSSVGTVAFAAGTSALLNASRRCFSRSTTSYTTRPVIESRVSSLARRSSIFTSCSSSPRSVLDIATAAAPRLSVCRRFSSSSSSATAQCAELRHDIDAAQSRLEALEKSLLRQADSSFSSPSSSNNLLSQELEQKLNKMQKRNEAEEKEQTKKKQSSRLRFVGMCLLTEIGMYVFAFGLLASAAAWECHKTGEKRKAMTDEEKKQEQEQFEDMAMAVLEIFSRERNLVEKKKKGESSCCASSNEERKAEYNKIVQERRAARSRARMWTAVKNIVANLPRLFFMSFVYACALAQAYFFAVATAGAYMTVPVFVAF